MAIRGSKAWLGVLFALILVPSLSQAAGISGRISLPGSMTASGTMFISIGAFDTSGSQPYQFENVTISAGGTHADFSLDSIPGDTNATWRISYGCHDNFEGCLDYVLGGYYDTTSTGNATYKQVEATTVSQGTSGVNFEFIEGIEFNGSLTSPYGNAPEGGIDVQMFFTSTDFSVSEAIRYEIEQDSDSVDFSVTMPNDVNLDYLVRYSCDTVASASDYCTDFFLTNGYYQSSEANNMVSSSGAAQSLAGNVSHSSIDMELIPGASISGAISRIASAGNANDVALSVRAQDQTGGAPDAFTSIVIPSGSDSEDYNLVVDPSDTSTWIVYAACSSATTNAGCADYSTFSYFDTDTAVTNSSSDAADADELAGDTVHMNKDFTLVGANSISGLLMLPDGEFAPEGGIRLFVTAQEFTGGVLGPNNANTEVIIAFGDNFETYSVKIPDVSGAEWRLSINCDTVGTPNGCDLLTPNLIFYDLDSSPDFSTIDPDEADTVSGAGDITGKNITLITAALATGDVILGYDRVAPEGGLIVRFRGRGYIQEVEEVSAFKLLTIPEGQNSAPYKLGLTERNGILWTIEIECDATNPEGDCDGYLPKSYHAQMGKVFTTSENPRDARLINPAEPLGTLDITLLSEPDIDELCIPIKAENSAIAIVCL